MSPYDWLALLLCSAVVTLAAVGEMKDILLCELAIGRAGDNIPAGYRWVLHCINILRRWGFLPALFNAFYVLIRTQGADAMSVCFNTIAATFLVSNELSELFLRIAEKNNYGLAA